MYERGCKYQYEYTSVFCECVSSNMTPKLYSYHPYNLAGPGKDLQGRKVSTKVQARLAAQALKALPCNPVSMGGIS